MKQKDFLFPLCPPRVSIWSCFSFLFLPLFSSLTPYSWSLPPPLSRWFVLSLSQCSCPPLIFTSLFSLPHHIPLSPTPPLPPTLCVLSSFSLCNISALPPFIISALSLSLPPADPPTSPPHTLSLCHVEVEPFVGIPRRRPLSFCLCCSPEGNVTLPPLPTVVAGYHGNRKDLQKTGLPPPPRPFPIILPTSSRAHRFLCVIRLSRFPQTSPQAPRSKEAFIMRKLISNDEKQLDISSHFSPF